MWLEVVRKRALRSILNGQLQNIPGSSCTVQDSGQKILGCTRIGRMMSLRRFRTPFLFGKFCSSIERRGEVLEGPGCVAGGSQKACIKIHSRCTRVFRMVISYSSPVRKVFCVKKGEGFLPPKKGTSAQAMPYIKFCKHDGILSANIGLLHWRSVKG